MVTKTTASERSPIAVFMNPSTPNPPASTVTIYGQSDDYIVIEGAICDEVHGVGARGKQLFFSDGTILIVKYDDAGCWRISRHFAGSADYSKIDAEGPHSANYSDRVTLRGNITWIQGGGRIMRLK